MFNLDYSNTLKVNDGIIKACQSWISHELLYIANAIILKESVLHNLCIFTPSALATPEGVAALKDLLEPRVRQLTNIRLLNLALEIRMVFGNKGVSTCRDQFIKGLISECGVPYATVKQLLKKYPYIWILPHIQIAFRTELIQAALLRMPQ